MPLLHIVAQLNADDPLGRFGTLAMPDQTLMELLVQNLNEDLSERYRDANGAFLDVCEWDDIECDAEGNVTGVCFNEIQDEFGDKIPIDLRWLPSTVTELSMYEVNFGGTVNTRDLPRSLKRFRVLMAAFEGTFDLSGLPEGFTHLFLNSSAFEGSLDLAHMPESVVKFEVSCNEFLGSIDLTSLPPALKILDLSENNFTGSVDFSSLPLTLRSLYLSYNKLSGEVNLSSLPDVLTAINLRHNLFTGTAVVDLQIERSVNVQQNQIVTCVDTEGNDVTAQIMPPEVPVVCRARDESSWSSCLLQ